MIKFYITLLIFAMLTLYLILILFFGSIEKHRRRNPFGMVTGNSHRYFVFMNERIRVSRFLLVYIVVAAYSAYEIYLFYN